MEQIKPKEIFLQKESEKKAKGKFEKILDKLKEEDGLKESAGFSESNRIKNFYKAKLLERSIKEGIKIKEIPEDLKIEMNREIEELDRKYSINGVHFLKCQFSQIIKSLMDGKRVEYEAFGPYLRDYFNYMYLDSVDGITLEKQDEIGLAIMKFLKKEIMPEAHIVSLYDEYNFGVGVSDLTGRPHDISHENTLNNLSFDRGRKINESENLKEEFKRFVLNVLKNRELIEEKEEEGRNKDFTLLSESQKIIDAKNLVKVLFEKGLIEGDINSEEGEIYFQNTITNCNDPRYLKIRLRDKDGHWECAALDASGFLDESNREITHLVILPKENFEKQQDQVFEILNSIGFSPKNYHNIFFDFTSTEITPESCVKTMRNLIVG